MTNEFKVLKLKNRMALLKSRTKDNSKIVQKIERQIRNAEKEN